MGVSPRSCGEVHRDAVEFLTRAVKADPVDLAGYDWSGGRLSGIAPRSAGAYERTMAGLAVPTPI
ncbi:MAG: hypothetical protein JWL68_1489 [Actinomycetia bacterium]|nr:hypothetical protein [Actinomycetes bacterium]